MSQFLNHVAIATPRNGTPTHTVTPSSGTVVAGTLFTPTAGRMLVCVVEGSVTSSTPLGWTLGASAISNTGLYVWYLGSAAGSDSIITTHNASNYPVVFDFYEFPASTTWSGAVSAISVPYNGGAGPTLASLTGTNQVYGVAAQGNSTSGTYAGSWDTGTEIVDSSVAWNPTDGYTYGVTEFVNYTASTASAAWTSTSPATNVERLMWGVKVPAGVATLSSTVTATSTTSGTLPRSQSTGTIGVVVGVSGVVARSAASGSVLSVATLSGTLSRSTISGNTSATTTISGTLSPAGLSLTGVVTAVSSVSGTLDRSLVAGISSAASIVQGTITRSATSGTTISAAVTSGTVSRSTINETTTSVSTVLGTLSLSTLSGTTVGVSTVSGTFFDAGLFSAISIVSETQGILSRSSIDYRTDVISQVIGTLQVLLFPTPLLILNPVPHELRLTAISTSQPNTLTSVPNILILLPVEL